MIDSEGVLPSRPDAATDDRGSLPAVPVTPAVPAATSVRAEEQREPVATPPVAIAQSLDERLAAVTAAGGLTALPADFGDPQGDWTTVRAENPFTVLYLDYRQAHRVTPEIVGRHRELLLRFWQEKLRSMSQGAARFAILKKYGGVDESERLIRSYPDLVERAYEQLATRGAIDSASRRIAEAKEALVAATIDAKLDDFLIDGVLQPEEMRALLEIGEREDVRSGAVAERLHQRLRLKGFVAATEPRGTSLEAQLLSTAWVLPSRRSDRAIVVPTPGRKSLLIPLFVFSLVVVSVLLVAAALRTSQIEVPARANRVDTAPPPAPIEIASAIPAPTRTVPPSPRPQIAPPVQQTTAVAAAEAERKERARAEERARVRSEIAVLREFIENDPQSGLDRIAALESSIGAAYVDERIAVAELRSALEKALLKQQMLARQKQLEDEASERARAEREREWEQRLAQIEELMKQPNYSGAKTLADQLLAQPDIPPPIAERAKRLSEQAVAELQKIFSGATVKSKTGRAPRKQK